MVRLPEVRISTAYLLLGCAWILGSDALVESLAKNHPMAAMLHSFKGLNFIFITAALLFVALHRSFGGWRKAESLRAAELIASSEKFRELSAGLQARSEDKRAELAREIHDEFGQRLTGIKLKLGLAEKILDRRDDRELNPLVDLVVETSALVDETIQAARRVSYGLRPETLDKVGLAAALEEEARVFTERTGIPCQLSVGDMSDPLPRPMATAAFRIFQESLTNVARHARATEVAAACAMSGGCLTLSVRDNGTGMNPTLAEAPSTLGLLGMWERARNAGGHLSFETSAGEGTTVHLELPVDPHPRETQAA
ncbi:sensor histidine kinase [Haloferula sargassicola]|uniref:sensor histidine kinase n=1 Tax=Haloferula sargassicola TaxID=490096 RepID=UPI00336560DA